MYELVPAEESECNLFFGLGEETVERYGFIGYLRADFGPNGKRFYTSWFDGDKRLKTDEFKRELDGVINSLQNEDEELPFTDRVSLELFCIDNPGLNLKGRGAGYKIRTQDFSYYARCRPSHTDYDIALYAYDNRYLLPELAGQHEYPGGCFSILPGTRQTTDKAADFFSQRLC